MFLQKRSSYLVISGIFVFLLLVIGIRIISSSTRFPALPLAGVSKVADVQDVFNTTLGVGRSTTHQDML
jgi:hypothetical protein